MLINGQKGDAAAGTGVVVEQPFLDAFVVKDVPAVVGRQGRPADNVAQGKIFVTDGAFVIAAIAVVVVVCVVKIEMIMVPHWFRLGRVVRR